MAGIDPLILCPRCTGQKPKGFLYAMWKGWREPPCPICGGKGEVSSEAAAKRLAEIITERAKRGK